MDGELQISHIIKNPLGLLKLMYKTSASLFFMNISSYKLSISYL